MTPPQIRAASRWARVFLGLSFQEFYSLTPYEWGDFLKLYRQRERGQDTRFAQLQLTVACSAGAERKDKRPLTLADFLGPDPDSPQPKKPKRQKAPDLMAAFMGATARHQHVYTKCQTAKP